jgi:hypothetical protein
MINAEDIPVNDVGRPLGWRSSVEVVHMAHDAFLFGLYLIGAFVLAGLVLVVFLT